VEKNMQKQKPIYLDHMTLVDRYKEYAYPKSKISQMVKSGSLIKIRRGLYLDSEESSYSIKTLANMICYPSYISFEYALSFYNMIPERVELVTSASYLKNKNKIFRTPVGTFFYHYLDPSVYTHGIDRLEENDQFFFIATREKALLDTLSKIKGVRSVKAMQALLEEDLRLDETILKELDWKEISALSSHYHQRNCRMLLEWWERRNNE
jgi:predicted transcriptional regulator of viral defense system